MRHTKHLEDLGFTVVATVAEDCSRVDFKGYAIYGKDQNGEMFWCANLCDPVSLDQADLYFHGQVKWDECSDWHFDEQDRIMLHACDRAGLTRLGAVLAACHDWAGELLDRWSPERPTA